MKKYSELNSDSKKVLRLILAEIAVSTGMDPGESVDGMIELMEAGFLVIRTDDAGKYWLEPTMPQSEVGPLSH